MARKYGLLLLYGLTLVVFIFGPFIANIVNQFLILLLPGITRESGGAIVGGMVEPWSSKFIPAIVVLGLFNRISDLDVSFPTHAPWLGLFGGLIVGMTEAWIKIQPEFYPEITEFGAATLASTVLHALMGLIVVGTFFASVEDRWPYRRDYPRIVMWTLVAMGFHVFWNVWLVDQDWFRQFWFDLWDVMS